MKTFDKMNDSKMTRRSLLKGFGAVAASGALAGCSTGDGMKTYFEDTNLSVMPPAIPGKEIKYGATPHNCGGGCLSKYYTENGVVKRIVTDEDRPDGDVFLGKAQFRSCLRCRSRREWLYRNDRLTVPLSRFDESGREVAQRGDLKKYVRRSWNSVIKEIVAKQKAALDATDHDPRTIMCTYGLGDRTMQNYYMKNGIYAGAANGGQGFSQDLSYPQWIYTYNFIDFEPPFRRDTLDLVQLRAVYREGNARADMINSNKIVIWAANPAETRSGVNTTHFLNKMKDDSTKEIFVVDTRYTMTAQVYADKFLGPVAGTDAALVLGMLHHLITETWNLDGTLTGRNLLNSAFVKRYIHGFFDDSAPVYYNDNINSITKGAVMPPAPAPQVPGLYGKQFLYGPFAGQRDNLDLDFMAAGTSQIPAAYANPNAYHVPAGSSLSAYVLGKTDGRLTQPTTEQHLEACLNDDGEIVTDTHTVNGALNAGTSVYPATIGYNVTSDDPLYGKTTNCYGDIAKTPEWASEITGIPAQTIREMAEMYASRANKVTTYHGAGVQRHSEGEQFCWLLPIFCTATGQFGQEGRSYGFIMEMTAKPAGMEYGAAAAPIIDKSLVTNNNTKAQLAKAKTEKWNAGYVTDPMNVGAMMTSDMYPVFTWSDLFSNANTGKSMWNYGKIIKTTVKPSVAWVICGGPVTQSGNAEFSTSALKNIETIIAVDVFMTPSVECADYILPAKAVGEKWGMTDGYITSDTVIMQPVSDGPSEAKTEFEIGKMLAEAVSSATGKGYQTLKDPLTGVNTTVNNDYDLAKYRFNMFLAANKDMKTKGWTFEKFLERGYMSCLEEELGKDIDAKYYGGRPLAKHVARELYRKGSSATGRWKPFEPLVTVTGKVEAFCQMMTEEYEASHNMNLDTVTNQTDTLGGPIYTQFINMAALGNSTVMGVYGAEFARASAVGGEGDKAFEDACDYLVFMSVFFKATNGTMDAQWATYMPGGRDALKAGGMYDMVIANMVANKEAQKAVVRSFYGNLAGMAAVRADATCAAIISGMASMRRYVYPIPMYIPCVEGRHASTNPSYAHPDPLNYANEFPLIVQSFHFNYRAHSVLSNVSYLAELYKRDKNGEPAYLTNNRKATDGAWADGVYEPVYINPRTASQFGIVTGDRVKVSNGLHNKGYKHVTANGAIFASAVVTEKVAPFTLGIGDSALRSMMNGIDVGGCVNTLYHGRPSRIGFGMSLGSDVRVKIEKA